MVYADVNYYMNDYNGTLPINSFDFLILKASKEIDRNINTRLTQDKINDLSEEAQEQLKYTACALVDLLSQKQESDTRKLSSFSIDGVSKTFKVLSDTEYKKSKREILDNLPIELIRY